jgi:hypothetical protein
MSFLYLENIFEQFINTLLLIKAYKAIFAIVWKDWVLSLFLFDVQRFKNQ